MQPVGHIRVGVFACCTSFCHGGQERAVAVNFHAIERGEWFALRVNHRIGPFNYHLATLCGDFSCSHTVGSTLWSVDIWNGESVEAVGVAHSGSLAGFHVDGVELVFCIVHPIERVGVVVESHRLCESRIYACAANQCANGGFLVDGIEIVVSCHTVERAVEVGSESHHVALCAFGVGECATCHHGTCFQVDGSQLLGTIADAVGDAGAVVVRHIAQRTITWGNKCAVSIGHVDSEQTVN